MNGLADYNVYLKLFRGREDYIAQQVDDWYFPVESPLDSVCLERHLSGDATFGLYVLNQASNCHLLCIDIDIPKNDLDVVEFTDSTKKYKYLAPKLKTILDVLHNQFAIPSESILLEETGGRGYHIWIFFSGPLDGTTTVAFGQALKKRLDFEIEFFPKQGQLTKNRKLGNLVKLPLGVHRKYCLRSVFFIMIKDSPQFIIDGIMANLKHLAELKPVSPSIIAETAAKDHQTVMLIDPVR